MQSRLVQGEPERDAEHGVRHRAVDVRAVHEHERPRERRRRDQPGDVDRVGVEERDHHDRHEIVGDHRGREEDAKLHRDTVPEQHEHRDGERGVRRDGHPPRVPVLLRGDDEKDECGKDHPPERGGDRERGGARRRETPDGQLAFDLEADHEEEDRQQSVVDPVDDAEREPTRAEPDADRRLPEREERRAERRVADDDGDHGHQQEQKPRRWRPAREVQRRGVDAVTERAQHRLAQGRLVPRALVPPAVDEEGRRDPCPASKPAQRVVPDVRRGGTHRWLLPLLARRHAQLRSDRLELTVGEVRPVTHQRVVPAPEVAGQCRRVLGQQRRALRLAAFGQRQVTVHVAEAVAEPIPQARDHLVRGVAVRAEVAPVLDQRHLRRGAAQHMVPGRVHLAVESVGALAGRHRSATVAARRRGLRPAGRTRSLLDV